MATILVAEDNAVERGLMVRALASDGHQVIEAENGQVALGLLAANAAAVTILVTDVDMPEIDGIELAERALASKPGLKVFLMSGMSGGMERAKSLISKGVRTLEKPIALEKLKAEVRALAT